jgi:hypothetical protein
MASGKTKDHLASVLRLVLRETRALRYALLLNTWVAPVEGDDTATIEAVQEERRRVSELPGAFEQLTLVVGDAEQEVLWTARIFRRRRKPPVLGAWEKVDEKIEGRFFDLGSVLRVT